MVATALVTGGAGFIGSYVSRRLVADGWRVLIYDAEATGNVLAMLMPGASRDPRIHVESGAITDGGRLRELCVAHDVEVAIHLASPLTQDVTARPAAGIADICLGTAAVFEAAHAAGVRRVVWASSVAVFGQRGDYPPGPLANDACHRPPTLYGSCKSLCETLARRAFETDGLDVVGLRLSVVYGAGRLRGYMSYPSHMLRQAAAGEAVHIPWGRQPLHWQYVEEVADLVAMLLVPGAGGGGRTYNAPGDCRTWSDFGAALSAAQPGLAVTIADGMDPVLADVVEDYDAGALAEACGYRMRWPLERAVPDALARYRDMVATARAAGS